MHVRGWRCAVCGATRDIAEPFPWRCPNSSLADRHHVLRIVPAVAGAVRGDTPEAPAAPRRTSGARDSVVSGLANPFLVYDEEFAWAAFAESGGLGADARRRIVASLDSAVGSVDGSGFHATPFARSDELSDRLGFGPEGGVWVKEESTGVAGSQKARHLNTIMLHLLAAEELGHLPERPPLAIASCGNAALAAAALARAASWPIEVFVPTWMSDDVGRRLLRLGARVRRCERRAADPAGDPSMLRFRDAVTDGAIPFTVQGPENALCLDGGRTIGWEVADQAAAAGIELDRIFAQVGGGAFATCLSDGLDSAGRAVPMLAVQAEGCAPLAAAWSRADGIDDPVETASRWSELMTPWDGPRSVADGILDDETYDWLGVFEAMHRNGGRPVVAAESHVVRAHEFAVAAGYDVSPTGSAGLAGLLAIRGQVADRERVAVVMSGVAR